MPYPTCHRALARLACAGLSLGVAGIGAQAVAAPRGSTVGTGETAHTAAAVKAVDQHWLEAEEGGDAAWLDGMLLPGYRSVNESGTFATKAAIVAHASKNRGSDKMKRKADAWQAAHPVDQQVTIRGDTAILSFVSASPATKGKLYSSDVFVYVDGRWHALYSAHTGLGQD